VRTQETGVRSQEAEGRRVKEEGRSGKWKYDETVTGGGRKKECLFLTNEAIMLLKTKDRQNERSQTKPIKATKLLKTKENDCEQSHYVVENKGSIRLGD
jgi:hypothetical protein